MADVSGYLDAALELIRARSLRRDLDWESLCGEARRDVIGASDLKTCHDAIEALLAKVDRHSRLRLPWRDGDRALAVATALPSARVTDGIGILTLPSLPVTGPNALDYARAADRSLRASSTPDVSGWMVDLRDNPGGNMWPMLLAVGPILGPGVAGAFVFPDGRRDEWGYEAGRVFLGSRTMAVLDDPFVYERPVPVAVLTSGSTKSSGEAITVAFRGLDRARSFGAPTNGTPTANDVIRLSDGAALILTVSWMSDRTGRTYDEPIEPDVRVEVGSAETAARTWLAERR